MGELLSYSISVSLIILVLFPVLYQIVNRSMYFRFNRFAIICGLVLSLALPCVFDADLISFPSDLTVISSYDTPNVNSTISETQVTVVNGASSGATASIWLPIVLIFYFSGIIVLLLREIISFFRLLRIIIISEKKKIGDLTICRITDNIGSPFSWGNYIFLHDSEFENSDSIFIHEKAHTDKRHWIDILFVDVFCILLWYNPFVWMTRQLMKLNHEFEADDAVIRSGIDPYDYQRLLVIKAMGNRFFPVANSFAVDKRSFRKRVLIMSKRRSSKKPMLIGLCAIPAVALAGAALSMPFSSSLLSSISDYSLSRELLSEKKLSVSTKQDYNIVKTNIEPATQPDTLEVIPSPLKDQTVLEDIVRLSLKTINPDRDIKVNIEIVVDKTGRVKDVIADNPDGADIAAAIDRKFNGIRFEQITDNGKPVEVRFNIPIQSRKQK